MTENCIRKGIALSLLLFALLLEPAAAADGMESQDLALVSRWIAQMTRTLKQAYGDASPESLRKTLDMKWIRVNVGFPDGPIGVPLPLVGHHQLTEAARDAVRECSRIRRRRRRTRWIVC